MRFEERVIAPVPQAAAWEFLWQTERVAACLPGCRSVKTIEPDKLYRARLEEAIGPYKVGMDLDVTVAERRAPDFIRVTGRGQDPRLGVTQTIAMTVRLTPLDANRTALDVVADVEVVGAIATLGGFAIKRKAKSIVEQLARNLQAALQRGAGQR